MFRAQRSLIVSIDPKLGGGVTSMQRVMVRAHRAMGLEPTLAFLRGDAQRHRALAVHETERDGVAAFEVGYIPTIYYLNYLLPAWLLRRRVSEFGVVQVVSGAHAESIVPILARRQFVSWLATPFGDEIVSRFRDPNPSASVRVNYALRHANEALERATYSLADKTYALSRYTRSRLVAAGLSPQSIDVLDFPIDSKLYHPTGPAYPRMTGRRYVLTVGRADDERKNVASLLRVFGRVASRHPDVDLVVAGPVASDSPLPALAAATSPGGRVHFVGPLYGEELASAYRSAELFLMTSRQEGLGIVVLEAQASGAPCIVMRCGGSDELIEQGVTGWLVDQGDEEAFARRLDEALRDREARLRAGAAARASVEGRSFDAFVATLQSTYRETFKT